MAAPTSGFNSKVRINGAVYNAAEWSIDDRNPAQDATNVEGAAGNPNIAALSPGYDAQAPGCKGVRVRIRSASFDPTQNFCLAPLSITSGTYIALLIYPYGLGGTPWAFPSLYVESINHTGNVKALEPVSFEGLNDGGYTYPTT